MTTTFKRWLRLVPVLAFAATSTSILAQTTESGSVTGVVVEEGSARTLAGATVTLRSTSGVDAIGTTQTNNAGAFAFESVASGEYQLVARTASGTEQTTPPFTISAARPTYDAGAVQVPMAEAIELPRFEVTARQETFYNAIDRKVYNVGRDAHSAAGSASDLLQNIPSVQVDVDGEVSLRGDSNVQILVNGKSSALMNRDRATALEQMSADRIERIEVITNPSARYSPDGTGGIINLVLKRGRDAGWFSTARMNVGNEGRYNASISANYNPGGLNLFGTASVRQNSRTQFGDESREYFDASGGLQQSSLEHSEQRAKPRSFMGELGIEHELSESTEWTASLGYRSNESSENSVRSHLVRDGAGTITLDYDRLEHSRETEDEFEFDLRLDHAFPGDGQELSLQFSHEGGSEREREDSSDVFRFPLDPAELEETRTRSRERETELSADYVHPLDDSARIELGYSGEAERSDEDFLARDFDPISGEWVVDASRTNRFIHETITHAFYGTYGRSFGSFGALGGLRFEHTSSTANQVTAGTKARHDYSRLYPSLHLTYDLTPEHRLQLSYSHRVNQPRGDELNPYPRFDDPFEIEIGNPNLEPEDIHSIEAGYEYHRDDTTLLAAIYHRYRYNGITDVTRIVDDNVLLTMPENLSTSRSSGVELGATWRPRESLSLNLGANIYHSEINAGNLGLTRRRTGTAWDAKLNVNWEPHESWLVQVTSNYRAKRLTAQGERRPMHSTNLGIRYDLPGDKASVVLTISDVFNSMRYRTVIDTPELRSDVTRGRGSRVVYLGFVYRFGGTADRDRDDLSFEEAVFGDER